MRSTAILKGTENEYYRATYKSMGFSSDDMKDCLLYTSDAADE